MVVDSQQNATHRRNLGLRAGDAAVWFRPGLAQSELPMGGEAGHEGCQARSSQEDWRSGGTQLTLINSSLVSRWT